MDIDLLSKMVKELILDNDRVVLPGLGCFVAEVVPATFSDKGYSINPPYRRLYFRSKPDEGTLLVDFYVKSNDVEYALAEKIISDFLTELKSVIYSRKVAVFPGLGRLRATKENNLFFVADEDLDIYPAGFGLEHISLKTHQESRQEVREAVSDLRNILDEKPVITEIMEPVRPEGYLEKQDDVPSAEPESIVSDLEPEPAVPVTMEPESPVPSAEPEPIVSDPESIVSDPEPIASDPESEPVRPESLPDAEPKKKRAGTALKCLGVIVAVAAVLIMIYAVIGRLCPEWIDIFLYSPEELEIINK